jgi:uncharacterized DUF497 family protein
MYIRRYIYSGYVRVGLFEWDKDKARQNEDKHGVSFADTFAVFEDSNALTLDQVVGGEIRHVTIGMDAFGRVLVVVYTWRGDKIRIISAREGTRSEVRQYESEL